MCQSRCSQTNTYTHSTSNKATLHADIMTIALPFTGISRQQCYQYGPGGGFAGVHGEDSDMLADHAVLHIMLQLSTDMFHELEIWAVEIVMAMNVKEWTFTHSSSAEVGFKVNQLINTTISQPTTVGPKQMVSELSIQPGMQHLVNRNIFFHRDMIRQHPALFVPRPVYLGPGELVIGRNPHQVSGSVFCSIASNLITDPQDCLASVEYELKMAERVREETPFSLIRNNVARRKASNTRPFRLSEALQAMVSAADTLISSPASAAVPAADKELALKAIGPLHAAAIKLVDQEAASIDLVDSAMDMGKSKLKLRPGDRICDICNGSRTLSTFVCNIRSGTSKAMLEDALLCGPCVVEFLGLKEAAAAGKLPGPPGPPSKRAKKDMRFRVCSEVRAVCHMDADVARALIAPTQHTQH